MDDRWQHAELQRDKEEELSLKPIIEWKKEDQRPTWKEVSRYSPTVKSYWAQWNSLVIENGVLRSGLENTDGAEERNKTVVPRNRVAKTLREIQSGTSGGHLGVPNNLTKVR